MRVRLTTDAPLGHDWQTKGAEFTIVDKRPDQLAPGEVDERTGQAWLRAEWAVEIKPRKAAKDVG